MTSFKVNGRTVQLAECSRGKKKGWRRRWEGGEGGIYDISHNYIFSFLKSLVGGSWLSL